MFPKYHTFRGMWRFSNNKTSLQAASGWTWPPPSTLHPSTAATGCVWLFRQGQLIVIIYEAWSRSITADWKSLPVCAGWGWVGSVNPGTTVPHLLAICFDQLTKALCVHLCETSSVNRLVWKRTHCSVAFSTCVYTTGVKETSHVVKQESAYALGWWHHGYIVNVHAKREQDRGKSVWEWTRDERDENPTC